MQLGEGEADTQPLAVNGMQGPPCADRETETPHSRSWMAISDVLGPFLAQGIGDLGSSRAPLQSLQPSL